MPTIACHTLGCKVNQYDTQAMMELFRAAGYTEVPFSSPADIYLLNTCTVTGTGDKKSLQLARRLKRDHPAAMLILGAIVLVFLYRLPKSRVEEMQKEIDERNAQETAQA